MRARGAQRPHMGRGRRARTVVVAEAADAADGIALAAPVRDAPVYAPYAWCRIDPWNALISLFRISLFFISYRGLLFKPMDPMLLCGQQRQTFALASRRAWPRADLPSGAVHYH